MESLSAEKGQEIRVVAISTFKFSVAKTIDQMAPQGDRKEKLRTPLGW